MATKLKKDALASEIAAINGLISDLDEFDFISRNSLEYKKQKIEAELLEIEGQFDTIGRVILAFEGGPVTGSRGIDTNFAAKTLEDYQDLVAKQVVAQDFSLARTGPVPFRNAAKLNITNVVHGSFGFELEEVGSDQMSMVDSPVKSAISAVDSVLQAFSSGNEDVFQTALAAVDRRVFLSIQSFYENMYRDSAALKIIESDRDITISQFDVLRARNRITGVEVLDVQVTYKGELLGLAPISRRFDFRVSSGEDVEKGTIISGQVGQRLSSDYLERLHGSSRISGQPYKAVLNRRHATRIDGSTSESFTLIELEAQEG